MTIAPISVPVSVPEPMTTTPISESVSIPEPMPTVHDSITDSVHNEPVASTEAGCSNNPVVRCSSQIIHKPYYLNR
ncbi:hypothetical protein V6N11_076978 [Hibiscus sabdariffa]|uniref:Uncharacterized protein n=1 Tax=Hibiscus sabdariffa TaxID=183260 RepID=A0ABR2TC59_9ROSI